MIGLILLACNPGKSNNLIDELRIVGIQSVPAEIVIEPFVMPGGGEGEGNGEWPPQAPMPPENAGDELESPEPPPEQVDPHVNVLVADPLQEGGTLLFWTCVDLGEGCLEKELYADTPELWFQVREIEQGVSTFPITPPPLLGGLLSEFPPEALPFQGALAWVMACAPGVCPVLEDAKDGIFDIEALSNPFDLLDGLPMSQVSLSFRSLWLNTEIRPEAIQNPTLIPTFDESNLSISTTESLLLTFDYEINPIEENYAILNQFTSMGDVDRTEAESPFFDNFEGSYKTGFAIESADSDKGSVYMLLTDKYGGTDFWFGDFIVE